MKKEKDPSAKETCGTGIYQTIHTDRTSSFDILSDFAVPLYGTV